MSVDSMGNEVAHLSFSVCLPPKHDEVSVRNDQSLTSATTVAPIETRQRGGHKII